LNWAFKMNDKIEDDYKSAIKLPVNISRVAITIYIIVLAIILYLNINVRIPIYRTDNQYIEIKSIKKGSFELCKLSDYKNLLPGKHLTILLHPTVNNKLVQLSGDVYAVRNDTVWLKTNEATKTLPALYGYADITTIQTQTTIFQRIMSSFTGLRK